MEKLNLFTDFIPPGFGHHFEIVSTLDDGASKRNYALVKNSKNEKFVFSFQGADLSKYLHFTELYRNTHIKVPEIHWVNESESLILLEYYEKDQQCIYMENYPGVVVNELISMLKKIQKLPSENIFRSFYKEKFDWEWKELILKRIVDPNNTDLWEMELFPSLDEVFSQNEIPGHRDLQSTNLFISQGDISVIDFQDTMLIHPFYDLSSLVWDSYIDLRMEERYELGLSILNSLYGEADYKTFLWVSLQRKLHDIGAFINAIENGKVHFVKYVLLTIIMCDWIIEKLKIGLIPGKLWKNSPILKF